MDLKELAKMAADYPTIRRFLVELGSYEEFKSEFIKFFRDPRRFTYTPIVLARGRKP